MKKSKLIYIISALLFVFTLSVLLFYLKKEPVMPKIWSKTDSLRQCAAPSLSDKGSEDELIKAIDNSVEYLNKKTGSLYSYSTTQFTSEQVRDSLNDFKRELKIRGLTRDFFNYIKENYRFYSSASEKVLFTGYYEPEIAGSEIKTEEYKYPLYNKPEDIININLKDFYIYKKFPGLPSVLPARIDKNRRVVPYFSRDEIDFNGALQEKNLEIVWCKSPVEIFFLQIQGSGRIRTPENKILRVGYSCSNGHPYRAIGRYLYKSGKMELRDISMQSIKEYLKKNPDQVDEILSFNQSYVFFTKREKGPYGFLNVPVTGMRSIALDRNIFPKAGLCYVSVKIPVFDGKGRRKEDRLFRSFVLFQDTGGAIKTPSRVDLFTGAGRDAELLAGHLKSSGSLFFLIKK